MIEKRIEQMWELYRIYCRYSAFTGNTETISVPDFLGWLEGMTKAPEYTEADIMEKISKIISKYEN